MPEFLNTHSLNEAIPELIKNAETELVIIVPYIKTSDNLYNALLEMDNKGIESIIVYREDKLTDMEREKLYALKNLNLLHHPNIHAKCYMNEFQVIITSMNMYEYSEKNNREMGILMTDSKGFSKNSNFFDDLIIDIQTILNGSNIEKESVKALREGFESKILKTQKEKKEEHCRTLNKLFAPKKFEITEKDKIVCRNYYDKIDVSITYRAEVLLNMEEQKIVQVFQKFKPKVKESLIKDFRFYWNSPNRKIYLYQSKDRMWENIEEKEELILWKKGLSDLIDNLKPYLLN
jgi:phosphatidylserine/phosphatidylglycerophosphate/cardiolipin synthase-like enzyme